MFKFLPTLADFLSSRIFDMNPYGLKRLREEMEDYEYTFPSVKFGLVTVNIRNKLLTIILQLSNIILFIIINLIRID
jgi:hypothetical protein